MMSSLCHHHFNFRASLKLGLDKAVLQSMHGQQSSTTNGGVSLSSSASSSEIPLYNVLVVMHHKNGSVFARNKDSCMHMYTRFLPVLILA